MEQLSALIEHFDIPAAAYVCTPLGTGLIHQTWQLRSGIDAFVLQQINTQVFKDPNIIARNIAAVGDYLNRTAPGYLFVQPLMTMDQHHYAVYQQQYWRLFPFVPNSHTVPVVEEPRQAFEAARQFAIFTHMLQHFPAERLVPSLPGFHHLSQRYQQFEAAVSQAQPERLQRADICITAVNQRHWLVELFEQRTATGQWPVRVMHHDTKISNVLLNTAGEGLAVIDLDTIMPGYFFSDVGDMLRTYLRRVAEDEPDTAAFLPRFDCFCAIVKGYDAGMGNALTQQEKADFFIAGKLMVYMQTLRFLTDYLNNDSYYGARYPQHNLDRANNQLTLLQQLEAVEPEWSTWMHRYFSL